MLFSLFFLTSFVFTKVRGDDVDFPTFSDLFANLKRFSRNREVNNGTVLHSVSSSEQLMSLDSSTYHTFWINHFAYKENDCSGEVVGAATSYQSYCYVINIKSSSKNYLSAQLMANNACSSYVYALYETSDCTGNADQSNFISSTFTASCSKEGFDDDTPLFDIELNSGKTVCATEAMENPVKGLQMTLNDYYQSVNCNEPNYRGTFWLSVNPCIKYWYFGIGFTTDGELGTINYYLCTDCDCSISNSKKGS